MCKVSLQATDKAVESLKIVLLKEIFLLLPITYISFKFIGTKYGWICYIVTNVIVVSLALYKTNSNLNTIKNSFES